jgi:uncharacterized protein YkwD
LGGNVDILRVTTRAGTLPNRRNLATRRLAVVAVAVAAFAMGVACDPVGVDQRVAYPASGAGATPNNQAIHALLTLVNRDRTANGMRALAWDDQLGGLAATWSSHMVETGVFAHRDLDAVLASSPYAGWHALGENILVGDCRLTAAAMETAWMASPGHRANILSGSYSRIGIGVQCSWDGRVWATQEFGG